MFKKIVWLWFSSTWKNAKNVSEYIKSLVLDWAWEFFTWYNPSYWYEKFGFEVSPNGRFSEHEQVTDFDTLSEIVKEVHSHNLEIFVNLNARYYTNETFPLIQKMVEEIKSISFDWIICWNIWILEYLKEIDYKWKINISTILAVYNRESIRFFLENYKINKIILSREITLKEIEELVGEFSNISFEVFWEGDFCRYNNWLCFAEHKYWSKDICTVVLNDLVFKKKFIANYKKIILDDTIWNLEKSRKFDRNYLSIFDKIDDLSQSKPYLKSENQEEINSELISLIWNNRNRIDLFFDWLKPINSEHNQNVIKFFKWLLVVLTFDILNEQLNDLENLRKEIENSIKTWIEFLWNKVKLIWWESKLKALEIGNLYAKWDNLNLYSYLFFSNFKNIDTIKFPTRWRNYAAKIAIIEKVISSWKIDKDLIDRWISIERTHYDLTHIFWDKLWFRKMLNTFGSKN